MFPCTLCSLPADAFSSRMAGGPHLLAPTGSDLVKHGGAGTVLAGFHYDLNFITVSSLLGICCWGFTGAMLRLTAPALAAEAD